MAMGPKNVFNNKADFKVLLPLDRFRMTVGPDIPPRVSAARNEPNWEKRQMATKGHRSGQDAAPATDLPWLSRYPRGVDWRMPLRVAPLYALLDDTAARHGRLVCTNFLGKTLTYSEIAHLVDRTAAGLQRLGVKKGTKVGLFLPNSPTFIVYFFAVLKAGGTIVNYNPLYTVSELAAQVKDSDTEIMVTLDLKVLFDKVEALLQSNVLARAIVCSFAPLLPPVKATLFRLFKSKNLARPLTSPARDQHRSRRGRGFRLREAGSDQDRPPEGRRGAAIHGRHHRHAQGRHAHARQRLRERAPGRRLEDRPQRGRGARARGAAVLPRVRADRRHEPWRRQGRGDHHHAALLAR